MPTALVMPLAERAGGGFDARRVAVFGVARASCCATGGNSSVVDRQIVAGQVQQGVDQHGAVTVDRTKRSRSAHLGLAGLCQRLAPQHFGDLGHAHGAPGWAGLGFLTASMGQRANRTGDGVELGQ